MNRASKRGQVLVLLLVALMGGSSLMAVGMMGTGRSVDEIADSVNQHVHDKSRRKAAEAVLEAWKEDGERFLKGNAKRREQLLKHLHQHSTTREELHLLLSEIRSAHHQVQKTTLDHRFALKAQLTREEWQRVFAH